MANNTTWSFTGLPSGSSILSYSPEIPGVVFGLVNSDGVHTVLNAGGTPTQAGYFSPTIRVGTNACYKDVRVGLTVAQAATPVPSCAVAAAGNIRTYMLDVTLRSSSIYIEVQDNKVFDITPSEYGTFSFSYVSGQEVPGLSLVARSRTATHWSVDPASTYVPVTLDNATIAALAGKQFQAVWRVTFTATSGCQASLDFPVEFTVVDVRPAPGGSYQGGA